MAIYFCNTVMLMRKITIHHDKSSKRELMLIIIDEILKFCLDLLITYYYS